MGTEVLEKVGSFGSVVNEIKLNASGFSPASSKTRGTMLNFGQGILVWLQLPEQIGNQRRDHIHNLFSIVSATEETCLVQCLVRLGLNFK